MNGASYPKKITNADSCRMEPLPQEFSVCKVEDYSGIDMEQPFVFTGSTDEEKSLVCPTGMVPENTTSREDGWRAFRICGELDFSLIFNIAEGKSILVNLICLAITATVFSAANSIKKAAGFCF